MDWTNPDESRWTAKIAVALIIIFPTNCVPQPDTDRRLDVQGDKIMQRVGIKIGNRE